MGTKQSNLPTLSQVAQTADANSQLELIHQISLSHGLVEYASWLNAKVISLVLIGRKCNESDETTLKKILDFCSNEINQFEKEVLQLI